MATRGQYIFELNGKDLTMTDRLVKAGLWEDVRNQIEESTNLSGIFSDLFRGYTKEYELNVDAFNDDCLVALKIIEKNCSHLNKVAI